MGIETGRNGGSHVAAQEQQGGGRLLHAQHRAAGADGAGGSSSRGALHAEARWGPAQGAVPCCLGAWGQAAQEADLRGTGRMQGVAARREQRQRPGGEKGGARAGGGCRCKRKGAQEIGGLGCLYRSGEGILCLRVKKNGGTRPTRIGLRRRRKKKKRAGPLVWAEKIFFYFLFLQKDSTNSI